MATQLQPLSADGQMSPTEYRNAMLATLLSKLVMALVLITVITIISLID